MLTESDVIAAVCTYLEANGYEIRQHLTEVERGEDIVAVRGTERLVVEAKGETSSKSGSARFGKAFSRGQVHAHIAKALYCAAKPRVDGTRVAIALPWNAHHEEMVAPIRPALSKLGIATYWVRYDGSVAEDGIS